ncbi:hypothetical protein LTR66_005590 [Elasticomyces elasticus]|nr:hypothetical protein LTR66_005590 [Elasticomyces elasticus]
MTVSLCTRLAILASIISWCSALYTNSTALVLAQNDANANEAYYLLNGYGLKYETHLIPKEGADLPPLNSSTGGHYGVIIVHSEIAYDGTANGFSSVLTAAQWESLYTYQRTYRARMVHLNAIPKPIYGVSMIGDGCCITSEVQTVSVIPEVQQAHFPTAGIKRYGMDTTGLFHRPSVVINDTTTTAFFEFGTSTNYTNVTTAGVINAFPDGREQMAFFIEGGNFSETSTVLNHMWIQWAYRGLYPGFRRINLQTQVDDLFLQTAMYTDDSLFRLRAQDLANHVDWTNALNRNIKDSNPGSEYFTEFGFNANGILNYDYGVAQIDVKVNPNTCPNPIFTDWSEPAEGLEYKKPIGAGKNKWPTSVDSSFTGDCVRIDPLVAFLFNTTTRDAIGLVSHTFTHLELNTATYHDAYFEILTNLQFAEFLNFTVGPRFSGSGLIPPAITGLHNGDVLRAWSDNGLWNAIGDNTRPPLRNPDNHMWPRLTTFEDNGYDGYQITPRFATRVYYNCDLPPCNVQQWIDTSDGQGDIYTLLQLERISVSNQLMSLYHDGYMFHQPNLRAIDAAVVDINGQKKRRSLLQMWVETVTNEVCKAVDWPLITLKHDDIAISFAERYARDQCHPYLSYTLSGNASEITTVTVMADDNQCNVPVPITFPGNVSYVTNTHNMMTEQIGNDPLTIWVSLSGAPVVFNLTKPLGV